MTETEINIKASEIIAKPLPEADVSHDSGVSIRNIKVGKNIDIFNSASDRESVMIALAENHNITIGWYNHDDEKPPHPHWYVSGVVIDDDIGFDTHKDALIGAVEAVQL